MSASLAEVLKPDAAGMSKLRLWLKSADYTRKLLLGEDGDPWVSAAQYLVYFTQAQGLLRPDVAVIEVRDLYRSWVRRHRELASEMVSKRRTSAALRKMLEASGPRQLLAEVCEAVIANLNGQMPLVLSLPAPRDWIIEANTLAGNHSLDIDDETIESAAMYMADLMRAVSNIPMGGILIQSAVSSCTGDDMRLCKPILNVARHYRWIAVLRSAPALTTSLVEDFDALIVTAITSEVAKPSGLDVSDALWNGREIPARLSASFFFAEIPLGLKPEMVLDRLAAVRG